MYIKITYVGELNGVKGIWCGFKPEGAIISEKRMVLYPEDGYVLKKGDEIYDLVWLKDGDSQDNYIEEKV